MVFLIRFVDVNSDLIWPSGVIGDIADCSDGSWDVDVDGSNGDSVSGNSVSTNGEQEQLQKS